MSTHIGIGSGFGSNRGIRSGSGSVIGTTSGSVPGCGSGSGGGPGLGSGVVGSNALEILSVVKSIHVWMHVRKTLLRNPRKFPAVQLIIGELTAESCQQRSRGRAVVVPERGYGEQQPCERREVASMGGRKP
jgi:hypothetical protein